MVGVGSAFIALGAWLAFVWWRKRDIPKTVWFLRIISICGVAAVLALWCGWIVTEVGRQPWIVQGYMRTADAVTPANGVWYSLVGRAARSTPALGTIAILVLRGWRGAGVRARPEATSGTPYAPPVETVEAGAMSKADIAAGILWFGATAYALFGGADFGGGFWDLLAGGAEKGERPRALIQRSLTPVWEANHVWLIFILVVLWTAFPEGLRGDHDDPLHSAGAGRAWGSSCAAPVSPSARRSRAWPGGGLPAPPSPSPRC